MDFGVVPSTGSPLNSMVYVALLSSIASEGNPPEISILYSLAPTEFTTYEGERINMINDIFILSTSDFSTTN